jgi:hypothetical protein
MTLSINSMDSIRDNKKMIPTLKLDEMFRPIVESQERKIIE